MYLLNTTTYAIQDFFPGSIPPYAILSHTWNASEISFQDMKKRLWQSSQTQAFSKIRSSCIQARQDGYAWIWNDTVCIDKKSSAELSEAINSMFQWYQDAAICYVYLQDVPGSDNLARQGTPVAEAISKSKWFTRGWTLQELIAPGAITFFDVDWAPLGTKQDLMQILLSITKIPQHVLWNARSLSSTPAGERISWSSTRSTTRPEDRAYSLMGLFGVHMPIIYGEGLVEAFQRLQKEIIMLSPDQTIFAWKANRLVDPWESRGLLASYPSEFKDCCFAYDVGLGGMSMVRPFSMTNLGIAITLQLEDFHDEKHGWIKLATLGCTPYSDAEKPRNMVREVQIYLKAWAGDDMYVRVRADETRLAERSSARGMERIHVLDGHQANLVRNMELIAKYGTYSGGR